MIKPSPEDDAISVISHIPQTESFNIDFSRSNDDFPYQKVSFESFDLPPQLEKYPSNVRWISPSISPTGQHFSAIALNSKLQQTSVYIWELDHKLKKTSIKHHYLFDKVTYEGNLNGLTNETFDGSQTLVTNATMSSNAVKQAINDAFATYSSQGGNE